MFLSLMNQTEQIWMCYVRDRRELQGVEYLHSVAEIPKFE